MEKKEHWNTKVVGIKAKDIQELAKMITEINLENFVIATQPIKVEGGYDALVFIKIPPEESVNKALNLPNLKKAEHIGVFGENKPTEKQLRFLKEHKFKIEKNLTKNEATKKIRDYLDRLDKEKNVRKERYEDY